MRVDQFRGLSVLRLRPGSIGAWIRASLRPGSDTADRIEREVEMENRLALESSQGARPPDSPAELLRG